MYNSNLVELGRRLLLHIPILLLLVNDNLLHLRLMLQLLHICNIQFFHLLVLLLLLQCCMQVLILLLYLMHYSTILHHTKLLLLQDVFPVHPH